MEANTQTKEETMTTEKAPRMNKVSKGFAVQCLDVYGIEEYVEGEWQGQGWQVKNDKGEVYPLATIQRLADFIAWEEANPVHGPDRFYDEVSPEVYTHDAPIRRIDRKLA